MNTPRLYTLDPKSIHARVLELGLPSRGPNSKRSKVKKLVYAAFEEGRTEEQVKARYDGWTNYATWVVNCWMGENQAIWQGQARALWGQCRPLIDTGSYYAGHDESHVFVTRLAELLKSKHIEATPVVTGVYADLITAALDSVNWYEIAEHYLDDVKEAINASV